MYVILIQVNSRFSNRIIKKGDYFTIYIDIANGNEQEIKITEVKISQPMGFLPITMRKQEKGQRSLWGRLTRFYGKITSKYGGVVVSGDTVSDTGLSAVKIEEVQEKIKGASLIHELKADVQPKSSYSEIFYLKAGWSGGIRPRPDTYTISCDVRYELASKVYHNRTIIDISIFPSLGSMLAGAIVGSVLGTLVKELFSKNIQTHFTNNPLAATWSVIPTLFSNLILAFIIAVVLMRKKDVQPFLTIEDFWGGILVGFLASYTSAQLFDQLAHINILNPGPPITGV